MIMNEIIPIEVKKTTKQADEVFGRLLNVARATKNVDYEDGVYFVMPKDPRGIQLIMRREAAEAKAKAIEAEFANLTSVVN
jgi:aromatic ring hydroxylase